MARTHLLGWEYIIINRAAHPLTGCLMGSRYDPLETPDPVEMVSFNLGQGIRHPAQARKIPGVLPLRQLPS